MNCIFCKIIEKEIPGNIIYEDKDVIAFLDANPATKGHTLVLPKKHYENIFDIPMNDYLHLMEVVKKLAIKIKDTFNADGINIINNSGIVAGQSVLHFHVHIVPRFKDDPFKINYIYSNIKYDLKTIKEELTK